MSPFHVTRFLRIRSASWTCRPNPFERSPSLRICLSSSVGRTITTSYGREWDTLSSPVMRWVMGCILTEDGSGWDRNVLSPLITVGGGGTYYYHELRWGGCDIHRHTTHVWSVLKTECVGSLWGLKQIDFLLEYSESPPVDCVVFTILKWDL